MLFEMQPCYNLRTIEDITREFIKRKFPKPVEEESKDEFDDFLKSEYKLELAERLRTIANQLEKEALR